MNDRSALASARIHAFPARPYASESTQHGLEDSAAPPAGEPESLSDAELLDAVRDLGATAPGVAREVLRILESEDGSPAPSEPPDSTQAAATAPAPQPGKPRRRHRRKPDSKSSLLDRHRRSCCICGSEFQDEIEDAFLSWESIGTLARSFGVRRRAVYRHAHATGLFPQRDRNIRRALGLLIHRADKVYEVTADHVIRAARTLAQINEQGEWTTPPSHVIMSSGNPRPPIGGAPEASGLLDTPARQRPSLTP